MQALVHFVHGKESGPWGSKITRLAGVARNNGCDVASLDYAGIADPQRRADHLVAVCASQSRPLVLVGSSMGGWVATRAASQLTQLKPLGLFLLAPAFYLPSYPDLGLELNCAPDRIELVHGWRDDIIPYANSVRFGQQHGSTVHLVDDDHRLGARLETIAGYFALFLQRVLDGAGLQAVLDTTAHATSKDAP
jgi:pimeloyl-ACP methyl ester carboxylesterase